MAVTFYAVTLWIVGGLVLLFLLLMAFVRIDSHMARRRLDRMMREADAKRDARTPDNRA
jgi:Na+-transporting methylmalonyl-CoA/oxaloacetate decarboxylase gamma subunit